jgi:hypothetical protein
MQKAGGAYRLSFIFHMGVSFGPKRPSQVAPHMSAFGVKLT